MAFSIDEIISEINGAGGVLTRAHFNMMLTPPPCVRDTATAQLMQFLIQETTLPGATLEISPVKPHGIGLFEARPHGTAFAPLLVNIMVDRSANVVKFFQSWYQNIHNFNPQGAAGGMAMYDFQYPTEYETTIEIYPYDNTGKKVMTYSLSQAFPINIGEIGVSWEAGNEIMKLPVTFAYKYWTTDALLLGGTRTQETGSVAVQNKDASVAPGVVNVIPSARP